MSHRTRSGKAVAAAVIPPSKSKKKGISTRMKKSSASKRHLDSSSTTLTQPRQKRLSSLTAAALVHYCTSVLTPSRKAKRPSQTPTKEDKSSLRKRKLSNVSCKSDPKNTQTVLHTRTRREASSRASAMIMQQNEIERSRFNYTHPPAQTTTVIRPQRTKTEPPAVPPPPPPRETLQLNAPSTANLSKSNEQTPPSVNLKYPSLTEAILAEHDRLHATLPAHQSTKHEHLVKWTQELALCGRLSPHEITLDSTDDDTRSQSPKPPANVKEISTSSTADSVASHESIPNPTTTPSFLFPSAGYPLDFRSLYPLMPCWQYLGKQSKP